MKTITEKLNENNPVLITCFSKEKDLLGQWRAYSEDGTGIAIGFNLDILEKLYTSKLPITIDDVIYDKNEQKDSIECDIKISLEDMIGDIIRDNSISDEIINEYFEEEFDSFCEILQDRLSLSSCFIKNPAFKEEKEVRIVYDPKLYDGEYLEDSDKFECFTKSKHTKNFIVRPVKFNVRNKKIVAYADLNFSYYIKKGLISEIIIGPKSNIIESDIIYLLLSNGYAINEIVINKSQATYR